MPGQDGIGMTLIKDNKIITAEKGVVVPSPSTPNGIVVGWFLDLTGASDPARRTKTVITDNEIEARGETSMGICAIIDEAIITSNKISLGGSQARGIAQIGSNSLIAKNKIESTGICGIACTPYKDLKGSKNMLLGNAYHVK